MRKILIVLVLIGVLTGCQNQTRQLNDEKYNAYLTYYQSILDTENKETSCQDFNIELITNKISDSRYRYDVIIDDPKIAMYDVVVLVVVYNVEGTVNTKEMMPSIGIFGDEAYSMIPNQVDKSKNYVEGLDLSVVTNEPEILLGVMVSYDKKDGGQGRTHYFDLAGTYIEPVPEETQPTE